MMQKRTDEACHSIIAILKAEINLERMVILQHNEKSTLTEILSQKNGIFPRKWYDSTSNKSYRVKGICKRSRKAVHWLKTMLLEPDERRFSSSFKRTVTLQDSTQFFSISTWNRFSVGAVIRSSLLIVFL